MNVNDLISVVIRTMPGREQFLDKCLFVLSGQRHPRIEVLIVAQKLHESDNTNKISETLESWSNHFEKSQFHAHVSATDARARSLNIGKRSATGRYLAFLDDDDKVYPQHYQKLIEALHKTKAAWAYSDIIRALYNEQGQLVSRTTPYQRRGYSFIDHLRGNFIPIHSFVIDRERVPELHEVDEQLSFNEDYEFLLRLAFRHEPHYLPIFGAEYCIRGDGSNSTMDGSVHSHASMCKQRLWQNAQIQVNEKKVENFGWWVRELDSLPLIFPSVPAEVISVQGMPAGQNLKLNQEKLRNYYSSTSWRITRPLRNLILRLKGMPAEQLSIPQDEYLALCEIEHLLRSTSWEISAPLRLVRKILNCVRRIK